VKRTFALILTLCLSMAGALASDWEEDNAPKKSAPVVKDTVILDEPVSTPAPVKGGTAMLHGSATAVRTHTPNPYTMAQQAAVRAAEIDRIDAGANSFLMQAKVNEVVQPSVFRAFIENNHPEFSLKSPANSAENLLLIRGQWDDSSKPLHSLGLMCNAVKTKELDDISFDKYKAIIVDCAGELPNGAIQKIRDFVGRGGYLLTTDWALQNVIERSFPGFVQWNRDNTDGVVTDAYIVDRDSPLLTGVEGRRFTWKLDKMSQCVRILQPNRVHLIARSSRLAHTDPQLRVLPDPILAGALAFEINFGRGKILHLVGHFDNCSNSFRLQLLPDPTPGAGISLRQVLATNFLIEALSPKKPSAEGQANPLN
jgi:hypothetical protein